MRLRRLTFRDSFLLTLFIGGGLMFVIWQLASTPIPVQEKQLIEETEFLGNEVALLRDKLERTRDRLAVLEREASVQREANRLLQKDESRRQAEINRMRSQLDFYQRLSGTGGSREGLDIYQLELIPMASVGVYQYVLTMTQNIRRAAMVSGKVGITVEGRLQDRPVTLYWAQLSDGNTAEPAFRFKYFQQLEGFLNLPEEFEPLELKITLDTGQRHNSMQKSFSWQSVLEPSLNEND